MDSKNNIIISDVKAIVDFVNNVYVNLAFTESDDENLAIIKKLNVDAETLRSYTVLLQQAIDNYS